MVLSPRRSEGERQRGKNLSVDIGNRLGHPTSSRLRSGRRQALKRFIVLFLMEISTRGVEIGGIASKANGLWMAQIARNVTDEIDGFFKGKRYLIHDRDPWYTQGVSEHAGGCGNRVCKVAAQKPELECPRGKIRKNDQGRVCGANDLLW